MRSRLPVHRHPNGHWCHCSFGQADTYVPKEDREVYGSKTARWVEASKLEWLQGRPDMQSPEAQRFLERLELTYPDHDALYPWLAREYKKGRVGDIFKDALSKYWPQSHQYFGENSDNYFNNPLTFTDHQGYAGNRLTPDHLDQINDWMKYMKQSKKGVDLMKHEIGPALHNAQESDLGGEKVHEFDNGYWVAKLRNKRDMVREGQRCHHCVGSNGMPYIPRNDAGEGMYYSLRDSDNRPLGTAEIQRDRNEYYKCPNCGKFAMGEDSWNSQQGRTDRTCEHCGHLLHGSEGTEEGVQTFPMDLRQHKHPDSNYTSIAQMFGPHDQKMDDHHEQMFNEYFAHHGHEYYESDGDEPEEEEEEEYEPWWDEYYTVPGARTPEEYMDHSNGDYESYTPHEYDRAQRDAYEHDLEGPELEVEDPDWDEIWSHIADTQKPDPEALNALWKEAHNAGHVHELNERAREWLSEQYGEYLDPYGQATGPGYPFAGPTIPQDAKPAVTEPGSHYPGAQYNWEEYLARNVQYQLNKHRDPQTGREHDFENQLNNRYPALHPGQGAPQYPSGRGGDPRFPQAEPSAQSYEDRQQQMRNFRENPQMTWNVEDVNGTGNPFISPVQTPWSQWQRQTPWVTDPYATQQEEPQPFVPLGPASPENYFTPGQETTVMHQRALPMDLPATQTDMPTGPYNPNMVEMYGPGQQQGAMFPTGWYIDYAKKRAAETQLPEDLFMPDHFGYHQPPISGQTALWQNVKHPITFDEPPQNTNQALVNTQADAPEPRQMLYNGEEYGGRPRGPWHAKTSGEWTDVEGQGGKRRPKIDRNKGYGVWDQPVHKGRPHLRGRVVVHNHAAPHTMPGFDWRLPVVYDKDEDRLYVGQRGMEHGDLMKSFHKDNPWGADFTANGPMLPGYVDVDSHVGSGGLQFFKDDEIPNEDEFHDWVENEYGVRHTYEDDKPPLMDWNNDEPDDPREASYHPRQEDEWVAEDEPVFSALIPEPRWKV